MKRLLFVAIAIALAACGDSQDPRVLEPLTAEGFLEHLEYLADDSLYGRGSATEYELEAARYVADRFEEYGLEPGAGDGYLWTFWLSGVQFQGPVSRNVIGVIPGRGELASEWVVVGAHYDHIGYRSGGNGYEIFNGADDNASGTAMMLELARYLGAIYSGTGEDANRRSIMFMAFGSEEIGLVGSNAFCADPTVPMTDIAAMINMDMVGRLSGNRLTLNGAFSADEWTQIIIDNNDAGLELAWVNDALLASDHRCFYTEQRPMMLFHTGLHEHWHDVDDDVERINLGGMVSVGDLVLGVLHDVATAPERMEFTPAVVAPAPLH